MKNILKVLTALFIASILTACGGESSPGSSSATNSSGSAELIIDNGRGTSNGTDNEMPKR